MRKIPTNITGLRNTLNSCLTSLLDDKIDVKVANAINNSADKILTTLKVQKDYNRLKAEIPSMEKIAYLESD